MPSNQPGSQFWGTGSQLADLREKPDKGKGHFDKLSKKEQKAKTMADKKREQNLRKVKGKNGY